MTLFFVIPVRRSQGGLTLVELLVVLSLVAVLSTVALRSVSDTVVEKRYDANLQQLEEIKLAVLGDKDRAGFLGDIGRLPVARGSVDVEQLVELWDKNAAPFEDYAIRTPAGDGEVRLGTGWRGPYLNLGINRRSLTDGFGEPYRLWKADGTTAGDGEIVAIVQSLGADKGPGGTSYDEDLEGVFEAEAGAVAAPELTVDAEEDRWHSDLSVIVVRDGGPIAVADGAHLIVRAYGADGSGGLHTVVEEKHVLASDTPSHAFPPLKLPHGAKVLRAYQESTNPATKETPIESTLPERKSPATHVVVDRSTGTVTLTLY